jgi:xanthosine utilization system XapX-like protein
MDNLITGAASVLVFLAFVGGLAQSIGAPPFVIIVTIVGIMLVVDFYQSAKEGLQKERDRNSTSAE